MRVSSQLENSKNSKTPFMLFPQKQIYNGDQVNDDEIPSLVPYKKEPDIIIQREIPQHQTQINPIRSLPKKKSSLSPFKRENKQQFEPKAQPNMNFLMDQEMQNLHDKQILKNDSQEKEIEIYEKPEILKENVQPESFLVNEKLIEEFLRELTPQLTYVEIENQSNLMVEKMVDKYGADKEATAAKIKLIRNEMIQVQKTDIRSKFLNQQIELLSDKLLLTERVIYLYRDKLTLRSQVANYKEMLNQLASKVIQMDKKYNEEIIRLESITQTLPGERERKLKHEYNVLEKRFEKEKELRKDLEKSITINITTFQNLFKQASEAKSHIIEQLQQIKNKKDEIEQQKKLLDDEQQRLSNKQKQPQVGKGGFSFQQQDRQHSFSSNSSKQQSSIQHEGGRNYLSKFQMKNPNQQTQDSFLKQSSDRSLTQSTSQQPAPSQSINAPNQGDPKRQASLQTINENDIASPQSYGDDYLRQEENSNSRTNFANISQKQNIK